jgi:hypothetical protein
MRQEVKLLKEILSFCHECEKIHFYNSADNSEIYYCPRLEMLAVRTLNQRQPYWLMRPFGKADLVRSAKELVTGIDKEMFKKFGANA